jgi:hypothetical protein
MPIANGLVKIDAGLADEDAYEYMYITNGVKNKSLWDKCLENAKYRGKIDEKTYARYKKDTL